MSNSLPIAMILLSLFFLALSFGLVSGQQRNATVMRPNSKESVLDSCQALKEEAQEIRQEGYSAIDKADIIRDQAYRVKDEAYDLKDEAYDIKESALEARSALETTLLETLILMRSQATATNLYIQEIRTTLSSLTTRIDKLEQGQGQIKLEFGAVKQGQGQISRDLVALKQGQDQIKEKESYTLSSLTSKIDMMEEEIEDDIDEKVALLSEKQLTTLVTVEAIQEEQRSGENDREHKSGELIPATRVEQSSTIYNSIKSHGPQKAVDGDINTLSHTGHPPLGREWFRYYFAKEQAIGQIKVVNGVWDQHKTRLNGAKVFVMANDLHRSACRFNTIIVQEGVSLEAQTYYLDCTGNTGIGVEIVLDNNYLELKEIGVYAP